ncbi:hypothetical protein ACQKWADRAFT_248569 [Trichoderma austrokoningii]
MPSIDDEPMEWEECALLIKKEVEIVERAIRENEPIAVEDTFPIRSLHSTFNGYAPAYGSNPQLGIRVEDSHSVPEVFRLAITFEHSVSLIVSSLIRQYHGRDGQLLHQFNEQAADIEASWGILSVLKLFIASHKQHFMQYGDQYAAVRRGCVRVYEEWNAVRAQAPPIVREVPLETFITAPGVVMDLVLELTQLRLMIQTGDMNPGVGHN